MSCTEGRKTAVKFVRENKHYGAKHSLKEFPSKHWSLNTCHTWALWRWVTIKRYANRHMLYFTLLSVLERIFQQIYKKGHQASERWWWLRSVRCDGNIECIEQKTSLIHA